MDYAFRVFAAIYGYRVVDGASEGRTRDFIYGGPPSIPGTGLGCARIPARYSAPHGNGRVESLSKARHGGEEFYLFHGLDPVTRQPDWLGEIFEWLSCSWETGISIRDSVGRVPYAEMIFRRAGAPTWKPQAALQMAWLEDFSRNGVLSSEALPKAPAPAGDAKHLVVCSHDVDFYYTNRRDAALRLIKNLAISALLYRNASYFVSNFKMFLRLLARERVGDYLPDLVSQLEKQGCSSTFFVVPSRQHRRDPNYALSDLPLRQVAKRGFPVELHASYLSLLENRNLTQEVRALGDKIHKKPLGNRQHWLRFGDQRLLFQAVEEAGLLFDSSSGFADTVGFRNGACFAFPPYDFKEERAHNFLEIPLAIMDGSLIEISRTSGEAFQTIADRVLSESRARGWGGIAILWHNPLEALSVPEAVNQVFWSCAAQRHDFDERWISTDEFLSIAIPRYQNAGLLKSLTNGIYPSPEARPASESRLENNRNFNSAQSLA